MAKKYIVKHFWSDKAPTLDQIPYGCWAEKEALSTIWIIYTGLTKKDIILVTSKH